MKMYHVVTCSPDGINNVNVNIIGNINTLQHKQTFSGNTFNKLKICTMPIVNVGFSSYHLVTWCIVVSFQITILTAFKVMAIIVTKKTSIPSNCGG